MRKLIILFAAACLLTACDKDKEADYIAQYFFGADKGGQTDNPDDPDIPMPGNKEIALERACETLEKVSDIYMECHSIEDLKKHADDISKLDNVEDVYFSDITMFVKVKDFMKVSFCFYPEINKPNLNGVSFPKTRQVRTRANTDYPFHPLGFKNAVIVDNQTQERDWGLYKDALKEVLEKVGIKTEIKDSPTLEYIKDGLFDNDIVLFISHGCYDPKSNLHWLSLEKFEDPNWDMYYSTSLWQYLRNELLLGSLQNVRVEDDKLIMMITQEWESYRFVMKAHFAVSENYITSIEKDFKNPGKALVFLTACQSLMKGDNSEKDNNDHDFALAQAFVDKGAAVCFGYDETNSYGKYAAMLLLGGIASGQSVKGSFDALPDWCVHNMSDPDDHHKTSYVADLFHYPEGSFKIDNSCQVLPILEEKEESDDNIILKMAEPYNLVSYDGEKNIDGKEFVVTLVDWFIVAPQCDEYRSYDFTYGFEVSTTRDFSPSLTKEFGVTLSSYWQSGQTYFTFTGDGYYHDLHFSYPVPKSDLEPDTKYFYRAYMKDANNTYYSDYRDFTFQGRIEQVVPDSIRDKMEPFIPIYEGNNPPSIEGVFVIDPKEIIYDTTNNYQPGDRFATNFLRFSNQNTAKNTLDFEGREVNTNGKIISESKGPGAFISGEGNNFTVFFKTSGVTYRETHDVTTKTSLVISGTKTSSGIKDIRYAFVMVEKQNDLDHELMDVGEFRVFKDTDGLAKTASWPSGARSWGWGYGVRNGNITTPWSMFSKKK